MLQEVQHGEQEDPDQIDEVPVQASRFDPVLEHLPFRMPHLASRAPEVTVYDYPSENVYPVQGGHGPVDGQERVVIRKMSVRDFLVVLETLDRQEYQGKNDRCPHVRLELGKLVQFQGRMRHDHGDARPDEHGGVESADGDVHILRPEGPLECADPQDDVGREQAAEEHDL